MVTLCAENSATAGSDKVDTTEADESQQDGVIRHAVGDDWTPHQLNSTPKLAGRAGHLGMLKIVPSVTEL